MEPFLWGLLPDNELILSRWAKRFHVSPRSAFDLLAHVGEDCAGAVQFVRAERRSDSTEAAGVDWLSEADVAERLRDLREHVDAWRTTYDTGQFSLAGAQPKTALLFDGERWGVPFGRTPTTHILKPPVTGLDGHVANEHLCLRLARALGLPAVNTEVVAFEDETTIVVERYDRIRTRPLAKAAASQAAAKAAEVARHAASDSPNAFAETTQAAMDAAMFAADATVMRDSSQRTPIYRVHQEDLCQALHVHPAYKYENQGGPGAKAIVELLRAHVSRGQASADGDRTDVRHQDIWTFIQALVFNWLIGGTDAHAKNYSVLRGGSGLVRLAPIYDVSSIFAYPQIDAKSTKLAMRIGREYRLLEVGLGDWKTLAADIRVDPNRLTDVIGAMARELPDRLADELKRLRAAKLRHPVLGRLEGALVDRARRLGRA